MGRKLIFSFLIFSSIHIYADQLSDLSQSFNQINDTFNNTMTDTTNALQQDTMQNIPDTNLKNDINFLNNNFKSTQTKYQAKLNQLKNKINFAKMLPPDAEDTAYLINGIKNQINTLKNQLNSIKNMAKNAKFVIHALLNGGLTPYKKATNNYKEIVDNEVNITGVETDESTQILKLLKFRFIKTDNEVFEINKIKNIKVLQKK